MRVAYVLKKFPRISETFILNEILELERQGVDVEIFSLHRPDDGVFHAKLAELKAHVVYLPKPTASDLPLLLRENRPFLDNGMMGFWGMFEELLELGRPDMMALLGWGVLVAAEVRRRGVDRMHAHFATVATWVARVAHELSLVPFSFTCHAKDIYREGVDRNGFRTLFTNAEFAVTVCDANARFVHEELVPGADGELMRLYNGVDLSVFHPRHRVPDSLPLVLGVGRLVEKKGFRYLIDAAARLIGDGRSLRCVIVGEGDQRPLLEEQIRAHAVEGIELVGMKTHEEIGELLARATMVVLPCVVGEDGNRDALPTVLLEALASGVPAISTPVAGVEEIVDDGAAGVLVPMHDSPAIEGAIAALLDAPHRCSQLAAAGRERAERCFDLAANVAALRARFGGRREARAVDRAG